MYIAILNWKNGENDPFTLFSNCLKTSFERAGRPAVVVNLDENTLQTISTLAPSLSFVFTWQGLGLNLGQTDTNKTRIWDELKLPLIINHGDHPCHMMAHHRGESDYAQHIYAAPSFALFANKHIPRKIAASFIQSPSWFNNEVNGNFAGNYFVFPKNLDDTQQTLAVWHEAEQKVLGHFLLAAFETIQYELTLKNQRDHHQVIDEMLLPDILERLKIELNTDSEYLIQLHVHALLDKVYRNILSEHVVTELHDVPIKIYGRGWDRFKVQNNPKHEYLDFDKVGDNAFQFSSHFGVLDASPIYDNLHDRTLRAIGNQSSFLSGSGWDFENMLGYGFGNLFFNTQSGNLLANAERVMTAPLQHREQCIAFSNAYRQRYSAYGYIKEIERMSESLRRH